MHDTLKAETLATLSQAQNVGNSRRIINWRRAITQWWPQALLDRSSCFFFLFVASAEISAVATNLKWSRATSWWRHRTLPAIYWWDDCHPNESFSCPHPFISSGMFQQFPHDKTFQFTMSDVASVATWQIRKELLWQRCRPVIFWLAAHFISCGQRSHFEGENPFRKFCVWSSSEKSPIRLTTRLLACLTCLHQSNFYVDLFIYLLT